MTPLAELFPDSDFRFHLTLRRGEPREFFSSQDPSGREIKERERWLVDDSNRYSGLLPGGGDYLAEFTMLCREWKVLGSGDAHVPTSSEPANEMNSLRKLGAALEPDFLFLSADAEGNFRVRGGVVCFPSGWALEEKLGHTLEFIHGVVPGLNPVLSSPINHFLSKLKPGVAFQRDNWGIAATDELNQHPSRRLPAPSLPVEFDRLWLRIEHQALISLPGSNGVLFGIRVVNHRLDSLLTEPVIAHGLARALVSMPAAVSAYKRLEKIRVPLSEALQKVT